MEKKYKSGLVLGKMMPIHTGHVHLIEEALKQCEKLTILVCSLKRQSIPGYMRYTWVKYMFPQANVVHVVDEVPDNPSEINDDKEAFWDIWTPLIKRNTPSDLDVVFTSEDYGDDIAEQLNIKAVCVDKDRIVVPISGTMIRNQPLANWDMIPPEVRHYFVKKVVVVGPESTAKTTTSHMLAEYFGTKWVPEYGREYTEKLVGRHFNLFDMNYIAAGQLYLEDELAKTANKLLICDTDLMTTQTFSEAYFNTCPMWIVRQSYQMKYDLHLLMDIDVPWVNDGTREMGDPAVRRNHFNAIKRELDNRGWKYVVISANGNYDERFKQCVKAIEELVLKEN